MTRQQTSAELDLRYDEQFGLLKKSCDEYDAGDERDIRRIALSLRILLHDTRRSKSLLELLGRKDYLFFDSARDISPTHLISDFARVVMPMTGPNARHIVLPCETPTHMVWMVPFEAWWNKVVVRVPSLFNLTRADLVLTMADQDGGAHVEANVEERYYDSPRDGFGAWQFKNWSAETDGTPVLGAAEGSVRQKSSPNLALPLSGPSRTAGSVAPRAACIL